MAQYTCSIPKTPGYVCFSVYLMLAAKCTVGYTLYPYFDLLYFNDKILYIPKVKWSKHQKVKCGSKLAVPDLAFQAGRESFAPSPLLWAGDY